VFATAMRAITRTTMTTMATLPRLSSKAALQMRQ
jgi:hypothetical protein